MLKKVAIGKLKPNPFRRLDEYPIQRDKVDALKKSIGTAGFWGGIVGREIDGGFVEVAFGHHRIVTLQELWGDDRTVEIAVRNLSNEDMLRMMANENLEEWGSSGWVELETIRATIDAFGEGLITLPEIRRNAPGAREVSQGSVILRYTKASVAEFLGWTRKANGGSTVQPDDKCDVAFMAMDAIGGGLVKESDLKGLKREQIKHLIHGVRRVGELQKTLADSHREVAAKSREEAAVTSDPVERERLERTASAFEQQAKLREAEAKAKVEDFVSEGADEFRTGKTSVHKFRELVDELAPQIKTSKEKGSSRKTINVDEYLYMIADRLDKILDGDDPLSEFIGHADSMRNEASPEAIHGLCQAAAALRDRLARRIEDVFGGLDDTGDIICD